MPPPPGTRPTEVLGYEEPPRGPWWQQGWGLALIAVVALLVGLGRRAWRSAKGRTDDHHHELLNPGRDPHHRPDTVQHTQTVTSTHTVTVTKEGSGEGGGGCGEAQSFNGTGSKNLGTVKVSDPSSAALDQRRGKLRDHQLRGELLSSEGHKGTASLAPGATKTSKSRATAAGR